MLQQKCNLQQNQQSSLPLSCSQKHCLVLAWLYRMPQPKNNVQKQERQNVNCVGGWGSSREDDYELLWPVLAGHLHGTQFVCSANSLWSTSVHGKRGIQIKTASPFSWIHSNHFSCQCRRLSCFVDSTNDLLNSLVLTASAGFLVSRREAN